MPIPPLELNQLAAFADVKYAMSDILAAVVFEQLIPLPPLPTDAMTKEACAELFQQYVASGTNVPIPDTAFRIPKWVFLEYMVKHYGMLVHGSADASIIQFEPRIAHDNLQGGDQLRVYAASSGILAGFYAIVDRQRLSTLPVIPALNNLYVARHSPGGHMQEAFHFALDHRALPDTPWHTGTVYLLANDTFTADVGNEQWWSEQVICPRAHLTLRPEEWPLLPHVRGVDFIALLQRSQQGLAGTPWWGDPSIYPALVDYPARLTQVYRDTGAN